MTIKELEARTGLDRATIRFYEKEGLIAPKRLANGYRDYSEEDALALEKIALLRRLDLPLEDIRRVQRGEVPLGLALEKQDEALLSRQKETAQALDISRAIRKDGASYQTLQPEKYKAQLPPPVWQPREIPPGEVPKHYATKHPWRRYLARRLDMTLYGLPWELAAILLFRISWESTLFKLLVWLMSMVMFLLLEPLLLSTWGTTPGKKLMGLQLQYCYSSGPGKPYYGEAFLRCISLCCTGVGFGIPLVEAGCMLRCYRRADRGEEQPWDEMWEYTAVPIVDFRKKCIYGAALIAILLCLIPVVLYAQRPVNHGADLTLEEYVENVNDIMAFQQNYPCYQMKSDGTWEHHRNHSSFSSFCIWDFKTAYYFAPLELQVDDGYVTGVKVDVGQCTDTLRKGQVQILLQALVFADWQISYWEMRSLPDDAYTLRYKDGEQASMTVKGWGFCWQGDYFTAEKAP